TMANTKKSKKSTKSKANSKSAKKSKKSPFAGLKENIQKDMNTGGKAKNNSPFSGLKNEIKNETSSKSRKNSPFSGLKQEIMKNIKTGSEPSNKKIDMAFLKSTVKDSLKEGGVKETPVTLPRTPTGIEGFDELIEGGLIRDSVTLVCGGPGSGKSIFAMQTLINGIERYGEPGVYITFEEDVESLIEDMKRFNWGIEEKLKNKQLAILYYSPEQVDRVLYIGGGPVREVIDEINAKRVVIDSITAFSMLYENENQRRRALMSLFKILKKWDCTSLLISEHTVKPEVYSATMEEFQSEGIIYMYHTKKEDVRERSIEVFKMRGTSHSTKINPLKISSDGITVYPEENVY
ncbi:MAG: RAD55 family ATPase, partial [Nanoarchaeota archaeon]